MAFRALATDYDGTIATHGTVDPDTLDALRRLKASGAALLLVTGREIPHLADVFPEMDMFDLIVAENGGLLYWPATGRERLLCDPPEEMFVRLLRDRGVTPLSVGRGIVATYEPHETVVLEAIRDLGLERQVIFNKGAVMVLPSGVNKASGLHCALEELGIAAEDTVGVGDAENDHALLHMCGVGGAVSNALPSLKAAADVVLQGDHGRGVAQLIAMMLDGSLARVARKPRTHTEAEQAQVRALGDDVEVVPRD